MSTNAETPKPLTAAQLAAGRQSFLDADRTEPRVDAAAYDPATQRLTLEMRGGTVISLNPRGLSPFASATDAQLAAFRVLDLGASIFWDDLDIQATTTNFLAAVFGIRSSSESARKAGSVRSEAKTAAVRANGAKGGRPRKLVAA